MLLRFLAMLFFIHVAVTAVADDPLAVLDDEFGNPATLSNWSRVHQTEGWNADQLEHLDINTSRAGWMTMMPYTSTWYNDYRGELTFKLVTGDFAATTYVHSTARDGVSAPGRQYSLAGVFARNPRPITNPSTQWTAGGENYVFLSLGSAQNPGTFQFEVKTTVNSASTLIYSSAGTSEVQLQVARLGQYFIMLRRTPPGGWVVHQRYNRPDMVGQMQVGMTVYTDWPNASGYPPYTHNSTVITGGQPDLIAEFDYYRFRTPQIPPAFVGADFSNPLAVSDAQLLTFLGDNAVPVQVSAFELE